VSWRVDCKPMGWKDKGALRAPLLLVCWPWVQMRGLAKSMIRQITRA
jgi:hypothetical protein